MQKIIFPSKGSRNTKINIPADDRDKLIEKGTEYLELKVLENGDLLGVRCERDNF